MTTHSPSEPRAWSMSTWLSVVSLTFGSFDDVPSLEC